MVRGVSFGDEKAHDGLQIMAVIFSSWQEMAWWSNAIERIKTPQVPRAIIAEPGYGDQVRTT